MSQYQKQKLRYFLSQVKDTIRIDGDKNYKLVTISNTGIIKKRKTELGINIKAAVLNKVHKGDFIYSRLAAHTGSFGIIPEELDLATASNEMPCFKIDKTKILPEYLDFILKQKSFINKLKLLTQGMGRVRIKEKQFLDVEIEYHPNITTQHIFLKKFMSIHKYERVLTEESIYQTTCLTKLRQAILQEAIEGKLTADWRKENPVRKGDPDYDAESLLEKIQAEKEKLIKEGNIKKQKPLAPIKLEEVPFDLPEGWIWTRLGEVCDFITKGTTPSAHELLSEGEIPYLKVYNIVDQKINFFYRPQYINHEVHNRLSRSKVYPDDVLMNIVGPPLGKVAIIPDTYPEWNINQALAIFRCLVKAVNKYIYYHLLEGSCITSIQVLGVVGQDNISLEQSRDIIIALPPITEQQTIINRVEKLLSMVDELEKQVSERKELSKQLMQAVLREAFEGES